jgi:N-acetylmuramoyl-L-alanine amidase
MSVRATGLAWLFLCGAMFGGLCAAERTSAAGPSARAANDFPVASEVRLGGDDAQTRMVVDFSQGVDIRAFTLGDPYRVVIDMPQVSFQFRPRTGEIGRGLIKVFRFGLVMPGGSRMVIDLKHPARIDKAVVLDPANDQPARLVLDLTAISRDEFMRLTALGARLPDSRKPEPQPEDRSGDPRPLVVIDPGHGGIDNGTRAASGEMEKTIVLEFSLMLRDKMEKLGKYRVAMTRSGDSFVPLGERVALARSREAALFISIHADHGEREAQGAAVYTLSERPSDARAARVAETENQADIIAGLDLAAEPKDVASILLDLARRETKTYSVQLAQALIGSMKSSIRLHQNPMKSASFRVLKAPDVPSVLIELGFVSNKTDLKSLISPEWRERTTDAIVDAIETYFNTRAAVTGQN